MIIDHGKVIAEGTLAELVDRTVGRHRLVTLRLDAPLASASPACAGRTLMPDGPDDGTRLRARLTDVAAELPPLLDRVRAGRPRRRGRGRAGPEPPGRVHPPDRKGAARVMRTLIRVGLTNLRRDRVAQAMTFVLPIIFFSIFATVFGGRAGGTARDEASRSSTRTTPSSASGSTAGLAKEASLEVQSTAGRRHGGAAADRAAGAKRWSRTATVPVAVVIPAGIGAAFAASGFGGGGPPIQLLADVSDPIAPQMVYGLLQKVTMTAAPDLLMQGGLQQFEEHAGAADAAAARRRRRLAAAPAAEATPAAAGRRRARRRRWASASRPST